MAPARLRTPLAAAAALLGFGAWASACGAFSLNDIVPVHDAGDGARPLDAAADAGPCDASDPCNCLPTPAVLSIGKGAAQALAVDSTYAYWLGSIGGNPTAYRAPLAPDSGAVVALSNGLSIGNFSDFALLDPYIYLNIGNSTPYIARLSLDGGGTQRLTNDLPPQHGLPYDLRATPAGLYWTNIDSAVCFAALDGSIAPGDSGCGGAPVSPGLTPDAASYSNHLAVGPTDVYWSVQSSGEILRVALDGGPVSVLVPPGGRQERALATSGSQVFWTSNAGDAGTSIIRAAADGSGAAPVFTGPLQAFTLDATNVYVIVNGGATRQILSVPQAGGTPSLLACDPESPQYLAVDAVSVYWANQGDGYVKSVPK